MVEVSGDLVRIGGKESQNSHAPEISERPSRPVKKIPQFHNGPGSQRFVTAQQTIGGNLAPASASQRPIGFADVQQGPRP